MTLEMNLLFFIRTLSFGAAIFWTLIWFGKYTTFYIKGMRGEATKIDMKFPMYAAAAWAIFYWLTKSI